MMYEKQILNDLLSNLGISHKIDNRIKPIKHPNMASIEKVLKKRKYNYKYFSFTDTLLIKQTSLCETYIIPSTIGVRILLVITPDKDADEVLESMCSILDEIIPNDISYDIVGLNE